MSYEPSRYPIPYYTVPRERTFTLNDDDRAQWIDNDEGLYRWWRSEGVAKREFIRTNREELTSIILTKMGRAP